MTLALQYAGLGGNGNLKFPMAFIAEPVNTFSGNYTTETTDLVLPGRGLPLDLTRTYNSVVTESGPLGPGWTLAYSAALTVNADGAAVFASEDGARIPFLPNGAGGFTPGPGVLSSLASEPGGYVVTRPDQFRYHFDTTGRLTSETDRNGNALSFGYTGGDLTAITDTVGRVVALTYDASHRLTGLLDPLGRTVGYTYDPSGRLETVTDTRDGITTYGHDPAGRLATITDQNDHTLVTNTYGPDGRVIEQVDARDNHTTFAWEAPTQTATITDPRGGVTIDTYDGPAIISRRDGEGGLSSFTYDEQYDRTSITDPRGKTTTMTYDPRGNLLTVTAPAPLSYQQTFTYDAQNNLLTSTDGLDHTTTNEYDPAGNLIKTTYADTMFATFTRDPAGTGLLFGTTDPRDMTTTFAYDTQANLNRTTSPLGEVATMTYDGAGRLLTSVEPRGNVLGADPALYTTTYGYDEGDNLTTITDPLAHTTSYTYDPAGNRTSVTDANDHSTTYAHDEASQLASVTDAANKTTVYTYDDANNLITRTDPNDHTTSWTYDLANRVSTETDPLGNVRTIGYDGAGNPTTRIDANGKTTTFAYDELNRLTSITYAAPSTPTVGFSYDAAGNRTSMTDGAGTESHSFDLLDRLTGVVRGADSFAYTYDAAGNLLTRTYPGGPTTTYTYDDDNRMATVSTPGPGAPSPDTTAPTIPTGLTATVNGTARVDLVWIASTDNVGVKGYKLYRNNAYLSAIGIIGSTAISDTGLAANTTYTYTVSAIDAAGVESAKSVAAVARTAAPDTVAPTVPTGVSATATAWNQVNLTWTASTDNVGVTRYAIFRGGTALAVVAGTVTNFTDRSTLPSTAYAYTVKASDAAGKISAASSAAAVTTPACTACPIVTLRPTSDISATGFTPFPAGTRFAQLDETTSDNDTTYIGGGTSGTGSAVFGLGGPAGTAYAVTVTYVARQAVSSGAPGTMNVRAELWNGTALLKTGATHNLPTTYTAYTDTFTLLNVPAAALRVRIVQLSASTTTRTSRFTYLDADVTYAPADTTAPSVPTGLIATAVGSARVDLAWTASTDAVGVKGYKLYRNNVYQTALGVIGSTAISDTGLAGATTYTYTVSAIDAAGKESAKSTAVPATTAISTDSVAPSVPSGVSATATAWNSVVVSWTASTDNVGVTRYAIFRAGVALAVVTGSQTSFVDRSTVASKAYAYTVKASDAAGRISAASVAANVTTPGLPPAVETTIYTYDPAGNLLTETTPDGITARSAYDRAGRLLEVANVTATGTLSRSSYALDPAGNRTVLTTTRGSQYFGYDLVDRLTAVCYTASCAGGLTPVACLGCVGSPVSTPAATIGPNGSDTVTTWTYDPVGNRLTETDYLGTATYAYDAADRLTGRTPPGAPAISYAYDDNGNQTGAGSDTFSFDLADRLISATVGSTTETYTWSGDGIRLSSSHGVGAANTTQFVVDHNFSLPQVARERDGAGAVLRTYTYGASLISQSGPAGSAFHHRDGLGSVTDLTSYAAASLSWTMNQPFGAVRTAGAVGASPANPFGFTGQYEDPTGLYFMRARMYDPTTGRFLSTDPAAAEPSSPYAGAYGYVNGNPTRYTDPSGLCVGPLFFLAPVCLGVAGYLVGVAGQNVIGNAQNNRPLLDDPLRGANPGEAAVSGAFGILGGPVSNIAIAGVRVTIGSFVGCLAALSGQAVGGRLDQGNDEVRIGCLAGAAAAAPPGLGPLTSVFYGLLISALQGAAGGLSQPPPESPTSWLGARDAGFWATRRGLGAVGK